ncbi:ATP-binding protein [Candidatus Oleimmundimicrobium sp.]|uniref:ATP-binding protein n=1 Tax=Candidatus Oleimmundimicrobium sp. TaxID=3060597 RepID=UPI00271DF0EB|nr:ATP-binding protein [Candidatus Oleimmundimicrobium sp.]MDO8886610.1 ATP-binding protein [Candidatus Oleimmundimicrobium sp.]
MIQEVTVLSGKGGTGKTSLVASFAALAENKVMVDCDVDAADLHLILKPEVKETNDFYGLNEYLINKDICIECGKCEELCRFDAIDNFQIDGLYCEGCGICFLACPVSAIETKERVCGQWFISKTEYGPLVHAKLGIAQENSGKLVAEVRKAAKKMAQKKGIPLVITDGSPGIGCPVIASLSGTNLVLIVTEPTVSGAHDLERILDLCAHFKIKSLVCINKFDLNLKKTREIKELCKERSVEVVGKINYDSIFTEALIKGVPVVEFSDGETSRRIKSLWGNLYNKLSS